MMIIDVNLKGSEAEWKARYERMSPKDKQWLEMKGFESADRERKRLILTEQEIRHMLSILSKQERLTFEVH